MKRIVIALLLSSITAFASYIIIVHPITGRIAGEIQSADTTRYDGIPGYLINPEIPAGMTRTNWQQYYWTNDAFALIPQNWLDAEAALAQQQRDLAISNDLFQAKQSAVSRSTEYMQAANADGAFALLTLDQINILRSRAALPIITTNQFLTALSNAVWRAH